MAQPNVRPLLGNVARTPTFSYVTPLLDPTPRAWNGLGLGVPWGSCDSDVHFQVIGLVFLVKGIITYCHQPHAFFFAYALFDACLSPLLRRESG